MATSQGGEEKRGEALITHARESEMSASAASKPLTHSLAGYYVTQEESGYGVERGCFSSALAPQPMPGLTLLPLHTILLYTTTRRLIPLRATVCHLIIHHEHRFADSSHPALCALGGAHSAAPRHPMLTR